MQIKSIDPGSLKKRLDEGSAILIDVREPHEHAREHIEGARLVPLSRFQAEDFGKVGDKTAVFIAPAAGGPVQTRGFSHRRALATLII